MARDTWFGIQDSVKDAIREAVQWILENDEPDADLDRVMDRIQDEYGDIMDPLYPIYNGDIVSAAMDNFNDVMVRPVDMSGATDALDVVRIALYEAIDEYAQSILAETVEEAYDEFAPEGTEGDE